MCARARMVMRSISRDLRYTETPFFTLLDVFRPTVESFALETRSTAVDDNNNMRTYRVAPPPRRYPYYTPAERAA